MQFIQVTKQEAIRALIANIKDDFKVALCPKTYNSNYENGATIYSLCDILRIANTDMFGCFSRSKELSKVTEALNTVLKVDYRDSSDSLEYFILVE